MPSEISNRLLAIALFIFCLLFLVFTLNWITTISDNMPDTLTRIVFWVGYIALVLSLLVFKPFALLNSKEQSSIKGVGLGLVIFIIGSLGSIMMYNMLDVLLGVSFFSTNANLNGVMQFFFVIFIVLTNVIAPPILILTR